MGYELSDINSALSEGNTQALILYGTAGSPCVRRVAICLMEKGLDFDWVEVDLPNMEQRSPEYLALNPNGFVPTLSHGELVIFESSVINEYLEEQFPQHPLLPADSYARAQARMWMYAEGAMAKSFRPLTYQRLAGPLLHCTRSAQEAHQITLRSTNDPTDIDWEQKVWRMEVLSPDQEQEKVEQLLDWAGIVERALAGRNFLVGDTFSMADIAVYPRVAMYTWCSLPLDEKTFPNINRWMSVLAQHPSFEKSLSEQSKKMGSIAASPIMAKLRKTLHNAPGKRGFLDKAFVFIVGKILRQAMGVRKLLAEKTSRRKLPMPRPGATPVQTQTLQHSRGGHWGDLKLYTSPASPYCQRIELLMNKLGLAYNRTEVELHANQTQSAQLLALNPLGEVPILVHGKRIIYDAQTIAEYLLAEFSGPGDWQPEDSIGRAQHRMWLAHESGSHKECKPLWDRYVAMKSNPQPFTTSEENALLRIYDKLQKLERALVKQRFLVGENVQFADIAWYTQVQSLLAVPTFSLRDLPHISRWYEHMQHQCVLPVAASIRTN